MEVDRSSVLSPAYCTREKCMEELRQYLLWTWLEIENTKAVTQQEMRVRDDRVDQLRGLLRRTAQERDEAWENCQKLLLENLLLQQQMAAAAAPVSGGTTVENEFCDDSIVSSPKTADPVQLPPLISPEKPLPEKGKLLQAVMGAGPLLQTLLLAGPLPQWQHPPTQLESSEIPPVRIPSPPLPPLPLPPPSAPLFLQDYITNCGSASNKRGHPRGLLDIYPAETKHQRVAPLLTK
ncbi:hypothetical protein SAY86_023638 [Trapa natans]|uniref:Uncharacterized protein n=1 Tax=Trapa natans TaxID=22666 RepID=A0AAN7RBP4_TRANT|nr:hypothetical protein SAY86_023638 [Trapa natans]